MAFPQENQLWGKALEFGGRETKGQASTAQPGTSATPIRKRLQPGLEASCAERLLHMRLEQVDQDPDINRNNDDLANQQEWTHVENGSHQPRSRREQAQCDQHNRENTRPILQL